MRRSTNLHHHALNSLGRITITAPPFRNINIKPLPLSTTNINDIIGNFVLLCTSASIQYLELDIYCNWTPYIIYILLTWRYFIIKCTDVAFPEDRHPMSYKDIRKYADMKQDEDFMLLFDIAAITIWGVVRFYWLSSILTSTLSIHFNKGR